MVCTSSAATWIDTEKPIIIKRGDTVALKVELLKDCTLQVVQGKEILGAKGPPAAAPNAMPQPNHVVNASNPALAFDGVAQVKIASLELPTTGPLTIEGRFTASEDIKELPGS